MSKTSTETPPKPRQYYHAFNDMRFFYTAAAREAVEKAYREDISLFNYSWDEEVARANAYFTTRPETKLLEDANALAPNRRRQTDTEDFGVVMDGKFEKLSVALFQRYYVGWGLYMQVGAVVNAYVTNGKQLLFGRALHYLSMALLPKHRAWFETKMVL